MRVSLRILFQCFLCFACLTCLSQSQDKLQFDNSKFYIFIKKGGYSKSTIEYLQKTPSIGFYNFLGNYYIDRDKKNIINYKYIDQGLDKLFPDVKSSGFLCLDIENKHYKNVRISLNGSLNFNTGANYLINLIKYVKSKRPNIKVGIYGLPYSSYWPIQRLFNTDKLDAILKWVDYISPSLYMHYPDSDVGLEANLEYLRDNLQIALMYGERLNKPVIPYIWYQIHPSNKKYGKELISAEQMANYTRTIRNYRYKGIAANGIIWWEPASADFKYPIDQKASTGFTLTKDDILRQYIERFSKK